MRHTANGSSSCKSRYKTVLDTTITDNKSITLLLDQWGVDLSEANKEKTGLISTDCPQTESPNTGNESLVCNTIISNNYSITDDTGKKHSIERKLSF